MGTNTSCSMLCNFCGDKLIEEKKFESSMRQSQKLNSKEVSSLKSEFSNYLKDDQIDEIRADCQRKSFELEKSSKRKERAFSLVNGQPPVHVYLTLQELIDQSMQSEDLNMYTKSEDLNKRLTT